MLKKRTEDHKFIINLTPQRQPFMERIQTWYRRLVRRNGFIFTFRPKHKDWNWSIWSEWEITVSFRAKAKKNDKWYPIFIKDDEKAKEEI